MPSSLLMSRCTAGAFVGTNPRFADAVNVRSICNSNQFKIVGRKEFPVRISHLESTHGFSGALVQNLKRFSPREKRNLTAGIFAAGAI